MSKDWRRYLDDDFEDEYEKNEKIPHKPNRYQESKNERRERPQPAKEK